jgi:outer membrane protein assembly factor BamB
MNESFASKVVPATLIVVGLLSLFMWLTNDSTKHFAQRIPDANEAGGTVASTGAPSKVQGHLVTSDGVAANIAGSWPGFRGVSFDGVGREEKGLARSWPAEGPGVLWSAAMGEGYAGPAILAGRVYVLDYDREKQADVIRCLSLGDGREIWRYWYPVSIRRQHGMSRTVPAVTDKYLVSLGPKLHLTCLDSMTGVFRWMFDLVREFGAAVPAWYAGQCPIIENGKAIIAVGGSGVLMMAVDCNSGQIAWRTPNPRRWKMTHSSVLAMTFNGRRMYVYCGSGGVAGISADDGQILWEYAGWTIRIANVPTPVEVGEGQVLLTGGYNAGCMLLKLTGQDGKIAAEAVFRLKPEVFGAPQHTPIFYQGYIYGVRQDGQLVCLEPSGKVAWTSGSDHRFGLGPYIIADGLIYVMNDSGVLTLAEATPKGFVQLAEAKVLAGPESWGPMAIVSGRLIVRDLNRMVCLNVAQQ